MPVPFDAAVAIMPPLLPPVPFEPPVPVIPPRVLIMPPGVIVVTPVLLLGLVVSKVIKLHGAY